MEFTTSHIMGLRLQTIKLLGLPYTNIPFTTLNELWNVQSGVADPNGKVPSLGWLAIGQGGHVFNIGADGEPFIDLVNHGPGDCALIKPIPFILREASNDLDPGTRANYAMRQQTVINGTNYIAYYLRKFDLTGVNVNLFQNSVVDGTVTQIPWVPTSDNLHPTPPPVSPTGSVVSGGDYLSVEAIISMSFTDTDITELEKVANILFNTPDRAIISECGLVAATESTISAQQNGGGSITYNE